MSYPVVVTVIDWQKVKTLEDVIALLQACHVELPEQCNKQYEKVKHLTKMVDRNGNTIDPSAYWKPAP